MTEARSEEIRLGSGRRSKVRAAIDILGPMFRNLPRQLLRVEIIRFIICATRFIWFALIRRRLHSIEGEGAITGTQKYNIRGMIDLTSERSLRLIHPLVALEWVRTQI